MMETEIKIIKVRYNIWYYEYRNEQTETIDIGEHDMFTFDHDWSHYPVFSKVPRPEWVSTHFSLIDDNVITNTISVSQPFRIEKIYRNTIDPKYPNAEGIMYKIRAKDEIEG